MISRIRKCPACGNYTLSQDCKKCNVTSENTFPPRYSPQDRFGKYRRLTLYGGIEKEGNE